MVDTNHIRTIVKPWGMEMILAENESYILKKIYIEPKCSLSVQHHNQKVETVWLKWGTGAYVDIFDKDLNVTESHLLEDGVFVTLAPGDIHSFRNDSEHMVVLFETSSYHPNDIVRHRDNYGRA